MFNVHYPSMPELRREFDNDTNMHTAEEHIRGYRYHQILHRTQGSRLKIEKTNTSKQKE